MINKPRRQPRRRPKPDVPDPQQRARQREINRQLRVWTPRRIAGWSLVAAAVLLAALHWLAHLGLNAIPLSMQAQDFLIGYPTAALLGVLAAIILTQRRA